MTETFRPFLLLLTLFNATGQRASSGKTQKRAGKGKACDRCHKRKVRCSPHPKKKGTCIQCWKHGKKCIPQHTVAPQADSMLRPGKTARVSSHCNPSNSPSRFGMSKIGTFPLAIPVTNSPMPGYMNPPAVQTASYSNGSYRCWKTRALDAEILLRSKDQQIALLQHQMETLTRSKDEQVALLQHQIETLTRKVDVNEAKKSPVSSDRSLGTVDVCGVKFVATSHEISADVPMDSPPLTPQARGGKFESLDNLVASKSSVGETDSSTQMLGKIFNDTKKPKVSSDSLSTLDVDGLKLVTTTHDVNPIDSHSTHEEWFKSNSHLTHEEWVKHLFRSDNVETSLDLPF